MFLIAMVKKLTIDEKVEIVKSISDEILVESELRELYKTKKKIIAYDGFEPSGQIHIAQGLLRAITVNKLISTGIHFKFYVADWFAMLNDKMDGDLVKIRDVGEYFIEVWKASGMDLKNVEFIWTSEFIKQSPGYWETVLKLSMHSTVQRVLRCGQIMGREDSTSNPSAQILYPLMQAADIHHLGADIAQLGMDQRKVNALARDIFPKIGLKAPVAVHHHMLLGLQHIESESKGVEKKIEMKMSKSNPNSAIFMTDTREDVIKKFKKAYCPEGQEDGNPVLEYAKYIVFEKYDKLFLERPSKFGGNVIINSYGELRKMYLSKQLHPVDLKNVIAEKINELLEPVRLHFKKNARANKLEKKVLSYAVTR
jgi:tyrosyl-tRNA synthetase